MYILLYNCSTTVIQLLYYFIYSTFTETFDFVRNSHCYNCYTRQQTQSFSNHCLQVKLIPYCYLGNLMLYSLNSAVILLIRLPITLLDLRHASLLSLSVSLYKLQYNSRCPSANHSKNNAQWGIWEEGVAISDAFINLDAPRSADGNNRCQETRNDTTDRPPKWACHNDG